MVVQIFDGDIDRTVAQRRSSVGRDRLGACGRWAAARRRACAWNWPGDYAPEEFRYRIREVPSWTMLVLSTRCRCCVSAGAAVARRGPRPRSAQALTDQFKRWPAEGIDPASSTRISDRPLGREQGREADVAARDHGCGAALLLL
ncbi:MAG: hypothetical protein U0168_31650 [Nannocystaceae bacterium]